METTLNRRSFVSLAALPLVAPLAQFVPNDPVVIVEPPKRWLSEGTVYRFRPDGDDQSGLLVENTHPEFDGGQPHWLLPIFDSREFFDPEAKCIDIAYMGTPIQLHARYPGLPLCRNSVGSCEIKNSKFRLRTIYKPAICEALVMPTGCSVIKSMATGWVAPGIVGRDWNIADSFLPRLENGYVRAASSFHLTPGHIEIKTVDYDPLT